MAYVTLEGGRQGRRELEWSLVICVQRRKVRHRTFRLSITFVPKFPKSASEIILRHVLRDISN